MKKLLFIIFCLLGSFFWVKGAIPTFQSLEPTQFETNGLMVAYKADFTNELGIIYPAKINTLSLFTNLNIYGTFSTPSKITLLTLGTNYIDVSTNTDLMLNSPTNDAAQVIISLSAGAYQGQFLFITSQNGGNSFTLPDLSEQYDVPGAYVDLQGDWIGTTNRGLILKYAAPDWIEMDRADPGSTNGPFTGGTLINPTNNFIPYRFDGSTFLDSPFEVFSPNTISVAGMFGWIQAPANYSVGFGYLNGASAGAFNVAAGYFTLQNATTASYNVAIGKEAGKSITDEQNNIYIGSVAGGNLVGGKNIVIGADAGNVNWRYANNSVVVGYGNWGATGVLTNVVDSVVIGGRSGASPPTNTLNGYTNSITIGNNAITHGSNTATIGDTNVSSLYLGNLRVSPLQEMHYGGQYGFSSSSMIPTNIRSGNLPSGNTDLFTIPSGKRFVITDFLVSSTNQTTLTANCFLKTNGLYYRIGGGANAATNNAVSIAINADWMFWEAGETVVITNTGVGINSLLIGTLFSTNISAFTVKSFSFSGGNDTLYTCPSGKCAVSTKNSNFGSPAPGIIGVYANDSGSSRTLRFYIVPSGGTPDDSNIQFARPVPNSNRFELSCGVLFPGDSLVVSSDASTATQWIRVTLAEIPFP